MRSGVGEAELEVPTLVCPSDGHNAAPARAPPMPAWTCYAPDGV